MTFPQEGVYRCYVLKVVDDVTTCNERFYNEIQMPYVLILFSMGLALHESSRLVFYIRVIRYEAVF